MLYNQPPDFEAEVRFLTPEEGGRTGRWGPPKQGYRCDIHWDEDAKGPQYYMIWPSFLDESGQELAKGAEGPPISRAFFYIASAGARRAVYDQWLREGAAFHLCEGAHEVAACRVTKILRACEDVASYEGS